MDDEADATRKEAFAKWRNEKGLPKSRSAPWVPRFKKQSVASKENSQPEDNANPVLELLAADAKKVESIVKPVRKVPKVVFGFGNVTRTTNNVLKRLDSAKKINKAAFVSAVSSTTGHSAKKLTRGSTFNLARSVDLNEPTAVVKVTAPIKPTANRRATMVMPPSARNRNQDERIQRLIESRKNYKNVSSCPSTGVKPEKVSIPSRIDAGRPVVRNRPPDEPKPTISKPRFVVTRPSSLVAKQLMGSPSLPAFKAIVPNVRQQTLSSITKMAEKHKRPAVSSIKKPEAKILKPSVTSLNKVVVQHPPARKPASKRLTFGPTGGPLKTSTGVKGLPGNPMLLKPIVKAKTELFKSPVVSDVVTSSVLKKSKTVSFNVSWATKTPTRVSQNTPQPPPSVETKILNWIAHHGSSSASAEFRTRLARRHCSCFGTTVDQLVQEEANGDTPKKATVCSSQPVFTDLTEGSCSRDRRSTFDLDGGDRSGISMAPMGDMDDIANDNALNLSSKPDDSIFGSPCDDVVITGTINDVIINPFGNDVTSADHHFDDVISIHSAMIEGCTWMDASQVMSDPINCDSPNSIEGGNFDDKLPSQDEISVLCSQIEKNVNLTSDGEDDEFDVASAPGSKQVFADLRNTSRTDTPFTAASKVRFSVSAQTPDGKSVMRKRVSRAVDMLNYVVTPVRSSNRSLTRATAPLYLNPDAENTPPPLPVGAVVESYDDLPAKVRAKAQLRPNKFLPPQSPAH